MWFPTSHQPSGQLLLLRHRPFPPVATQWQAITRHQPWADTCETTRCQVFWGRFHQKAGGSINPTTDPRTDAAVAATTGEVRVNAEGRVARTEFSSSTGGFTAGGTFPTVPDEGDAVADNPNKQWTKVVNVNALERKFGKGKLLELVATERSGLGLDGGRITTIEFRFENGTVAQTGWKARTTLGLKSDWFTIGNIERGETEQINKYVAKLSQVFLGENPSAVQIEAWTQRVSLEGSRTGVSTEIVQSDAFAGTMLTDLYATAFGRQPDAEGAEYWKNIMRNGARFDDIGRCSSPRRSITSEPAAPTPHMCSGCTETYFTARPTPKASATG